MAKRPSYYKIYESAHINNLWFIAKAAWQIVKKLGAPYRRKRRGRPPKLEPMQAAVLLIVQAAQHRTFRASEELAPTLFKCSVDHVTIWRYFHKLSAGYLRRAISLLFSLVYLHVRESVMFVLDSTGISCERSSDSLKLHALAIYSQEQSRLAIANAGVTPFNVHDAKPAEELLIAGNGEVLNADAAYDSHRLRRIAKKLGFFPNFKYRRTSMPTPHEQAHYPFDKKKYRFRGLVEGIFGAMEVRHGNSTRCRLDESRTKDLLLKVVAFNLRSYMLTLAALRCGDFLVMWILKQTQLPKKFI